ncbi:MAG: plasmid mobilization relaxosome protein MobC [Bacteroidetes bacterium]|nr:plasmid mobilization relaxosome protein MobC [Bacteroidota bacterium]
MGKEKEIRNHWLTIRLNDTEQRLLEELFANTSGSPLSEYCRKILLKKPVNVKYRNVSVDDFLKDMLELKKELNAIGNNFNQAVHKLHLLHRVSEIQLWAVKNEDDKKILFQKIELINERVNQLYKIWSQ